MEESSTPEGQAPTERRPPARAVAAEHESKIDAMGLDKRRQVGGGTYGPSNQRVIMRFVAFFAVVALLLVGLKIAVDKLDEPPADNPAAAPWAQPNSPQPKPQDPLSGDPPGASPVR
jgi:hypothetical protein